MSGSVLDAENRRRVAIGMPTVTADDHPVNSDDEWNDARQSLYQMGRPVAVDFDANPVHVLSFNAFDQISIPAIHNSIHPYLAFPLAQEFGQKRYNPREDKHENDAGDDHPDKRPYLPKHL